jgi:hypothetical protein
VPTSQVAPVATSVGDSIIINSGLGVWKNSGFRFARWDNLYDSRRVTSGASCCVSSSRDSPGLTAASVICTVPTHLQLIPYLSIHGFNSPTVGPYFGYMFRRLRVKICQHPREHGYCVTLSCRNRSSIPKLTSGLPRHFREAVAGKSYNCPPSSYVDCIKVWDLIAR